jgi:hypothetical protein
MICHAKRINAQNHRMEQMLHHAEPLAIMILVCFCIMIIFGLADAYAAQKYAELINHEKVLIGALNGQPVMLDDKAVWCRADKFNLVEGFK